MLNDKDYNQRFTFDADFVLLLPSYCHIPWVPELVKYVFSHPLCWQSNNDAQSSWTVTGSSCLAEVATESC